MIRIQTLGTVGLTDGGNRELAGVLRQPKRFALLAYLALARPIGFHRRDSLLTLFWPELDSAHARAALRQSLYTLRRNLPEPVITTRGDEEVGLVRDAVWCDVQAFEQALTEGRWADALDLYQGELLSGFHFPDAAPELDYWLGAERDRLRGLALQSAWDAAAAAERVGEVGAARRFARRAAALAPLDEETARRQIELLRRTGDVTGALRGFQRWAERLKTELEVEPSPPMLELESAIRRALAEPAIASTAPAPISAATGRGMAVDPRLSALEPAREDGPPERQTPSRGAAAAGDGRDRRRVRAWAAGLVLLLLVLAGAVLARPRLSFNGMAATASPASQRVMILPFAYRGDPDAAYLSEGLVYLFSVALDGGGFRSIDPHGVVRQATADGIAEYDAAAAARLGERLDATHVVVGNVVETEGRLQVSASLYEREGTRLLARASASGGSGAVPRVVDQIAAELLTSRPDAASSRVTRLAGVTTESLTALKAYLEGENRLRAGAFDEAVSAFEAAVLADTLFALAHYRTSVAASWAFRGELATAAADRAMRYADRLPERERRLLAAHAMYRRGEAAAAIQALRDLAAMYPDDPEVWYRLGEVLLHLGPPNGRPVALAREPFRRAAAFAPLVPEVSYHLAQIEAVAGDRSMALEMVRQALEAAPSGARAPQLRLLRTLLGQGDGWERRLEELARESDFTVISATYNAAIYAGRPDVAVDIATLLTAEHREADTRIFGYLLRAELELALGRWSQARIWLDRIRQLDGAAADEWLALLAEAPGAAVGGEELRSTLSRLERADAQPMRMAVPWAHERRIQPLPRLYARGRVARLLDDRDALARAVAALRASADETAFALALAADLETDRTGEAGSDARGSEPATSGSVETAVLSPLLSRPARRYEHARSLEEQGYLREALVWYQSLEQFSIHDLPWGLPALVDRGRIHESLGEEETAAALYRRFLDLWAAADSDPAGLRERARAGLLRTSSATADAARPSTLPGAPPARRLGG